MDRTDGLTRAIRSLTLAAWSLCALIVVWLVVSLWGYWSAVTWATSAYSPDLSSPPVDVADYEYDYDNDFRVRPLEEKIRRATIIILVERKEEDGRNKAVITEIVKRVPGTRFYYDVGDEYEMLSHVQGLCGDCEEQGDVVFLTGNPAEMRFSNSYADDRIGGFGGITIADFRRLVRSSEQARPD